jgi:hypothetical protein
MAKRKDYLFYERKRICLLEKVVLSGRKDSLISEGKYRKVK